MRIKHGSDTYPETITKSAGKTHVRYDIEETEFEEMDGTKRTCYDFSYVAIEGELTRAKIVDAIIVDEIGGVQNLSLLRIGNIRKCLFVEGKDIKTNNFILPINKRNAPLFIEIVLENGTNVKKKTVY